MKTLLKWLILLPIAAIVIVFATINRHPVKVVLDPFGAKIPGLTFEAPLYLVILSSIILGVLIGGIASWLKQGKYRKAAREARSDVRSLERETQQLRSQAAALPLVSTDPTEAYRTRRTA